MMAACDDEVVIVKDELKSPPAKRLKQALLSFPVLSPKAAESQTQATKKRKLEKGDADEANCAIKSVKTDPDKSKESEPIKNLKVEDGEENGALKSVKSVDDKSKNGEPTLILKVENDEQDSALKLVKSDDCNSKTSVPTRIPKVENGEESLGTDNLVKSGYDESKESELPKVESGGHKSVNLDKDKSRQSDSTKIPELENNKEKSIGNVSGDSSSNELEVAIVDTVKIEPQLVDVLDDSKVPCSTEENGELNQTVSSEADNSEELNSSKNSEELNSSKSELEADDSSSCNESSFLVSPEEKSVEESKDSEDGDKDGNESERKDGTSNGKELNCTDAGKSNKTDIPDSKTVSKTKVTSGVKTKRRKVESLKEKEERQKKRAKAIEEREKHKKEKEEQKKNRREERDKQKEERIKKKQAEIEAKQEEKKQKDEERKAKLEEKKQKEEEKKRKEEQKLIEKKKKEEERKQKEEERKQKEEEKLKAEEEEKNKKSKDAKAFARFFISKKSDMKTVEEQPVECQGFMPFQVKSDMRMAPQNRVQLTEEELEAFDHSMKEQSCSNLYLQELKLGKKIRKSGKTWRFEEVKDDVQIIDEEESLLDTRMDFEVETGHVKQPRPKLFLFEENRRPPYWGTWSKKSTKITSRKPFIKDETFFDYEVDSDDEWEEEEESGESLKDSDEEMEPEDDYDIDNDFLVPHGYLSDEEAQGEDEDEVTPESQEARLNLMKQEFEEELKQKTTQIKPRLIGCIWTDEEENTVEDPVFAQLLKIMGRYKAVKCVTYSIPTSFNKPKIEMSSTDMETSHQVATAAAKKKRFPEQAIPDLVHLIHGNVNGRAFLIKEFTAFWCRTAAAASNQEDIENTSPKAEKFPIPKSCISRKIKELATWQMCLEEGPLQGRMCWYVSKDVRDKLGLGKLGLPNSWTYILKPKRESVSVVESPAAVSPGAAPQNTNVEATQKTPKILITKFTKVLTPEERQKQLLPSAVLPASLSSNATAVTTSQSKSCRKRIMPLVSVPRGQEIPRISTLAHLVSKPLINPPVSSEKRETNALSNNLLETKSDEKKIGGVDCITLD